MLKTGPKDFDALLGQTQLLQAAFEFKEDYQGVSVLRQKAQPTPYSITSKVLFLPLTRMTFPLSLKRSKGRGNNT
jgi:hypothetical protein